MYICQRRNYIVCTGSICTGNEAFSDFHVWSGFGCHGTLTTDIFKLAIEFSVVKERIFCSDILP